MKSKINHAASLLGLAVAVGLLMPGGAILPVAHAAPVGPATNSDQARYLAGVRQAVSDFQRGVQQEPTDPVMAAGYRQGLARAQQWRAAHPVVPSSETSPEPGAPGAAPSPAVPGTGGSSGEDPQTAATPHAPRTPTGSQADFLKLVGPAAVRVAAQFDLYPSVMIAQAILESNWGQSDLSRVHHNLFGIKGAFDHQSVAMPTTEHLNGRDQGLVASFRAYPDVAASLADYAAVLAQPCYAGAHRSRATSWRAATRALAGTYATDPDYAGKLARLIEGYQLDQYDHQAPGQGNPPTPGHPKPAGASAGSVRGRGQYHLTRAARPRSGHASPATSGGAWGWSLPVASGAGLVGLVNLGRRLLA